VKNTYNAKFCFPVIIIIINKELIEVTRNKVIAGALCLAPAV